jgi:hypothetical protein
MFFLLVVLESFSPSFREISLLLLLLPILKIVLHTVSTIPGILFDGVASHLQLAAGMRIHKLLIKNQHKGMLTSRSSYIFKKLVLFFLGGGVGRWHSIQWWIREGNMAKRIDKAGAALVSGPALQLGPLSGWHTNAGPTPRLVHQWWAHQARKVQ